MSLALPGEGCVLDVYNNGLFWLHCLGPTTPVIADEYCDGNKRCNTYNCPNPWRVIDEWRSTFNTMPA